MSKTITNGLFITFEGPECSGKSTQVKLLSKALEAAGYDVLLTREPGGTVIGEELRRLVKHVTGADACCEESELFIFCASRAQLARRVIQPHLATGGVVICDRFADSTTAYQGYGRGMNLEMIRGLHRIAVAGRPPDVTILMDLPVAEQLKRASIRNIDLAKDRFEDEDCAFHERVRAGYSAIAESEPDRVRVVRADCDIETIHRQIMDQLNDVLA